MRLSTFRRRAPKAMQARTSTNEPQSVTTLSSDGSVASLPDWLAHDRSWALAADGAAIVVVMLNASGDVPASLIGRVGEQATVLVVGPTSVASWREESLAAGAFNCLSRATSPDDRTGLLLAAIKYETARGELRAFHQHSEQLCYELVESFGGAMEQLQVAEGKVSKTRDMLDDIRERIVRALV